MSGQGYEELKILNSKLDELLDKYNNLKAEYIKLKTGNEAMIIQLQDRENRIRELEIKNERIKRNSSHPRL